MSRAAERSEGSDDQHRLVDRRKWCLLQAASEPAQRVTLATRSIMERDQRGQFQGLAEIERPGVANFEFGSDEVAALKGSS